MLSKIIVAVAVLICPDMTSKAFPLSFGNHRHISRAQDDLGNSISDYSVSDLLTGDHKYFREVRKGFYHAAGSFSQLDPNGYIRTVDYDSSPFGTRQAVTGSENGLYVNTPYYSIRPNAAPLYVKGFVG